MGFSVSGSAVLLFAGLLIAFGMWTTAAANTVERISDAEADRFDRLLQVQNTDIELTGSTWTGATLSLSVENTGVTSLRVSAIDIIVDGKHAPNWDQETDGDIIRPEQTVTLSRDFPSQPDRAKVVTGWGIADTLVVS